MPEGEVQLAEPPVMPEAATADFGSTLGFLPMALGAAMMALLFSTARGSASTYLVSGVMGVSMMSMGLSQIGRGGLTRSRRVRGERRDYLRYLAQVRRQADEAVAEQRTALFWDNPDPRDLWSVAVGPRLWERRAGNEDFAAVRFGLGVRRSALVLVPPQTKPGRRPRAPVRDLAPPFHQHLPDRFRGAGYPEPP